MQVSDTNLKIKPIKTPRLLKILTSDEFRFKSQLNILFELSLITPSWVFASATIPEQMPELNNVGILDIRINAKIIKHNHMRSIEHDKFYVILETTDEFEKFKTEFEKMIKKYNPMISYIYN